MDIVHTPVVVSMSSPEDMLVVERGGATQGARRPPRAGQASRDLAISL